MSVYDFHLGMLIDPCVCVCVCGGRGGGGSDGGGGEEHKREGGGVRRVKHRVLTPVTTRSSSPRGGSPL